MNSPVVSLTLLELFGHYSAERDLCDGSKQQFRIKLKHFSGYLKRPATLDDLNEPTVNGFLEHRLTVVGRFTVNSDRQHLIALWNAAYDLRLVDRLPGRVKRIRRPGLVVAGWTPEQMSALVKQCNASPGRPITGRFQGKSVDRADYWRALILFAYDTGLRLGDVMQIVPSTITYPEPFQVVQRKTGKPVSVAIGADTWDAVRAIGRPKAKSLFRIFSRRYFFRAFRELVEAAGLQGTFKYLRRTSGSMAEAMQAGGGSRKLGHADPTVFDRFYNVRLLTERPPILPPRIAAEARR